MTINPKSLEKLRVLINEETEYRSGRQLVNFFNALGFNDIYGQGFPSRKDFTDDKLHSLNGTADMDRVIKAVFSPLNFIGRPDDLDKCIDEFNNFLAFDGWRVVRNHIHINFEKLGEVKFGNTQRSDALSEEEFLNREFKDVKIESLRFEESLLNILVFRLDEIKRCLSSDAPLAVIFMCGSTLEGILLGIAIERKVDFNKANSSPKNNEGKVRPFQEWTLNNLIDTAYELRLIKKDVKKFSHALRDFRNYIHPYQQLSSGFNPDKHTAAISWQVLKAAIYQLGMSRSN